MESLAQPAGAGEEVDDWDGGRGGHGIVKWGGYTGGMGWWKEAAGRCGNVGRWGLRDGGVGRRLLGGAVAIRSVPMDGAGRGRGYLDL